MHLGCGRMDRTSAESMVFVQRARFFMCFPLYFRRAAKVRSVSPDQSTDSNTIRYYSLSELTGATKNFSSRHLLDDEKPNFSVYRGVLASGADVKVKRAQRPAKNSLEHFRTELELSSRVHHHNLVSLIGFCNEGREQLLVYENSANETLSDRLHDHRRSPLPWHERLEIALGVAKGVAHLHDHAGTPIVHMNIRSSSIVLDDKLVPKLSEVVVVRHTRKDSQQSRASMGYLPPEHYATGRFIEKSDVYAFGVVLLELLTAKRAFDRRRHRDNEKILLVDLIRSGVKQGGWAAMHSRVDPAVEIHYQCGELEQFLNLALYCIEDNLHKRPSMRVVVQIIEGLLQCSHACRSKVFVPNQV